MRIVLYPHQMASHGAQGLRDQFRQMGHRSVLVREAGNYRPRANDLILGWGNSTPPRWGPNVPQAATWVNPPSGIHLAVNKIETLRHLTQNEVKTFRFTLDGVEAMRWLTAGKQVIGRQRIAASQGAGIVVMEHPTQFVPCPLYTLFCRSDREYRVYVLGDRVIDYLQKKRPNGAGDLGVIRSAAAGWVYCRNDIKPLPVSAGEEAVKAVRALGLTFGGVDVLWGNKSGPKIIEVNTSPGIEGVGVAKIATAILELYGEQQ